MARQNILNYIFQLSSLYVLQKGSILAVEVKEIILKLKINNASNINWGAVFKRIHLKLLF